MRRRTRRWIGNWLTLAALCACLARVDSARAQPVQGCPIGVEEEGIPVERTFTDSAGRNASFFFQLPPGHDPTVPTGILMYFHGNDDDPNDNYVAPLHELTERANKHGLIAAGLKSIGTRVGDDGAVSREWLNTDSRLLHELLLSDFGGCFKLDRTRVYLEGASQGTCFLSADLVGWLWRDFSGGVLGLCGCWGFGNYYYPLDIPTLRSRFKVFVENTTGDFLHLQGVVGLDTYKYNFGLDVRSDLDRSGGHCIASRTKAAAALDWMLGKGDYPDLDADKPHWQLLDPKHNGLEAIDYDTGAKRFVVATQRADLPDDVLEEIEQTRWSMFADDPPGFVEWQDTNYPIYVQPPVQILVTTDYGATFTRIARQDTVEHQNLHDMIVAPDGSLLVSLGIGVRKVDEVAGTLPVFTQDGMLVYGLDRDDAGHLFAHGAVIRVQRSSDSGATWTELAVPVLNQNARYIVGFRAGYLIVLGDDGKVRYSQDAGDSFMEADLPGPVEDFAHYGATFYAVTDTRTLSVSEDAGATWQTAPTPGDRALHVEVLPNGDVMVEVDFPSLTYRSSDHGQTWERERGAHNAPRMQFAQGEGDQMMMVTTRGILRHSQGALLDLGTPLPPLTPDMMTGGGGAAGAGPVGTGGTAGVDGAAGAAAGMGVGTGGAAAGPESESDDGGGCGCRIDRGRPATQSPALLALLGLPLLVWRRARTRRRSIACMTSWTRIGFALALALFACGKDPSDPRSGDSGRAWMW